MEIYIYISMQNQISHCSHILKFSRDTEILFCISGDQIRSKTKLIFIFVVKFPAM